jgi:hypothetical protein
MLSTLLYAITGMATVLVMHAAVATALLGLGLVLRRFFGSRGPITLEDGFQGFWVGFALVLGLLMAWNFVFPVGPAALAVVLSLGWLSLWAARDLLPRGSTLPRWVWLAAGLFWLWVANLALAPVTQWDTTLYHMQGVRWARTYPVVPGLANLFGPLGFNNGTFLYDALVDAVPAFGRGWHFATSLLIAAFGAQVITAAVRFPRTRSPHNAFALPLLLLAAALAVSDFVSSYVTHVPAGILIIVSSWSAYGALCTTERGRRERAYDLLVAVVLATAAVATKTSAAVFAAGLAAVAAYVSVSGVGGLAADGRRAVRWGIGFVLAMGGAFVARGIVLSGYPLFPTPVLRVPVGWAVPLEHARAEYEFVVHSARATTRNLDFITGRREGLAAWIGDWWAAVLAHPYDLLVPVALAGVLGFAVLLLLVWRARRGGGTEMRHAGWLVLLPPSGALVAWFSLAPMPHYGGPFVWTIAAVLIAQAVQLLPIDARSARRVLGVALALAALPLLTGDRLELLEAAPAEYPRRFLERHAALPDAGYRFDQNRPQRTLRDYRTSSGLLLRVPDGSLARCWDAPLPCTPNPAPNLELREPGNVAGGFMVEGGWQMSPWPQEWRPDLLPAIREGWERSGTVPSR